MSKNETLPIDRIVAYYTQCIADGELAEGAKFPTVSEIVTHHQFQPISRGTVDRAMLILKDRGLIHGQPGKARWVAPGAQQKARGLLKRNHNSDA